MVVRSTLVQAAVAVRAQWGAKAVWAVVLLQKLPVTVVLVLSGPQVLVFIMQVAVGAVQRARHLPMVQAVMAVAVKAVKVAAEVTLLLLVQLTQVAVAVVESRALVAVKQAVAVL